MAPTSGHLSASAYWKGFEAVIKNFADAESKIHGISDDKVGQFAFRGQADASWSLHSSLHRRCRWTFPNKDIDENQLYLYESKVLTDLHRWGLHSGPNGHLPILSQLANLQHFGSPTRMIDITFNPLIALWFAVEEQWDNGALKNEVDGRMFAFNTSDSMINENDDWRCWEDDLQRPWRQDVIDDWSSSFFTWRPPRLHDRISAQNGGFLLGGMPNSGHPGGKRFQWKYKNKAFPLQNVRDITSIAVKFHRTDKLGRPPETGGAYTLRIEATAKREIREKLENLYGFGHRTFFPDFTGFATYDWQALKRGP